MNLQFIPGTTDINVKEAGLLEPVLSAKYSLLDILSYWLKNSTQSVTFSRIPEPGAARAIISLEKQKKPIAFSEISKADAEAGFGKYLAFPEDVHKYADQDGYTPDVDWFESRNTKLKIRWNENFDEYEMPPKALLNVIFSYAFSSAGMARIEHRLVGDHNYVPREVFALDLIFFGKNMRHGWEEHHIVQKQKFMKYYEEEKSKQTSE